MRYTTLRVTPAGVVLATAHARRLADDPTLDEPRRRALEARYWAFAAAAAPGVYALWTDDAGALHVEARPGSRLRDGMPTRLLPSPLEAQGGVSRGGPLPKPRPPSPYDAVRAAGVATLLTDGEGLELYEGCSAAVVAFDGRGLHLVPADRPRVASLAEALLETSLGLPRAPIGARGAAALLLVNAVTACEPECGGRAPFPTELRRRLEDALAATAARCPADGTATSA